MPDQKKMAIFNLCDDVLIQSVKQDAKGMRLMVVPDTPTGKLIEADVVAVGSGVS